MSYIAEERETHISSSDVDDCWNVYTRQRRIINKLIRNGFDPVNVEMEDEVMVGAEFNLDLNKISFKKAIVTKKEYTDEQRAAIRDRLMKGRGL